MLNNIEEYQKKHCTWSLDKDTEIIDPHMHTKPNKIKKIYDDVVDLIGNTPVVRLNKIPKDEGIQCEIVAKLEFFNPGGSLKDRVGKRTVHDLEKKGLIKPGFTLIEATSGNCGIGMAMLSAVKGYKAIITMQDKNSLEKKYILNSMGSECLRTPSDLPYYDPNSHIGVAFRLNEQIKDSRFLDQYSDDSNALVNYDETAEELWNDLDGKCDYVVMTVGTGGTITGIARKFKERNPNCIIVGVDPVGSSMAMPKVLNQKKCPFKVEGIGYDFVPKNLDQESVDIWFKSEDKESFIMARRIIRDEGILCGGSSGSALWAALEVARELPKDKRVCVIFCDSIRNYMSKFISDDWMIENEYIKEEEVEKIESKFGLNIIFGHRYSIKHMINSLKIKAVKPLSECLSVAEAFEIMEENSIDYLPVISSASKCLLGLTTMDVISQKLINFFVKPEDSIKRCIITEYKKITIDEPVNRLSKAFRLRPFVMVLDKKENPSTYFIVTPKNLTDYILLDNKN